MVIGPSAYAASTGAISGTVTDNNSLPVQGVCVTATDGSNLYNATTDSSGNYTITALPPTNYLVEFDPSCGQTVSSTLGFQYYNSASDPYYAEGISVGATDVAGINAQLELASTLSGTVTNGSTGVANVCVFVYTANGYLLPTIGDTDSGGSYSIESIPAGSYTVLIDPTCLNLQTSPYAYQYYNDQAEYGNATAVTFSTTPTTFPLNATLAPGASISGVVTAPGALNSGNICVTADTTGDVYANSTVTNANGAYDIPNLPADSYKIEFDPTCSGGQGSDFGPNWYNGAATYTAATSTSSTAGQSLTGVNASVALVLTPLSITTSSLPGGTESSTYAATVGGTGGTGPYAFVASGLPSGVTMNAASGEITGTPTVSGTFTVGVTVTDASTPPVSSSTSIALSVTQPTPPSTVATTTTTTIALHSVTVCTFKTKKITVHKIEIKHGKRVIVVVHETVRVDKKVAIKKTEKIHGKKVVIVTYKEEPVKVCKSELVS